MIPWASRDFLANSEQGNNRGKEHRRDRRDRKSFSQLDRRDHGDPTISRLPATGASQYFYALMAAGAVLRTVPTYGAAVVADATGTLWRVSDINAVCALVSVFIMGAFVLLAAVRLTARD